MTVTTRIIASIFGLAILALPALAQDQLLDTSRHDSGLPIEIEADSMEVEQAAQRATFRGAVDVKQGDLTLRADTLIVHYNDGSDGDNSINLIEVEGNVFFATPNETAQGDEGVYDVNAAVIQLIGNVVLTNADAVLRGEQATMSLETGQSVVTGTGERVKMIFETSSEDGQ